MGFKKNNRRSQLGSSQVTDLASHTLPKCARRRAGAPSGSQHSRVARIDLALVIRGVMPFLIAQLIVLALLVAIPALVIVPARWFY
jgi:hypothetical protein